MSLLVSAAAVAACNEGEVHISLSDRCAVAEAFLREQLKTADGDDIVFLTDDSVPDAVEPQIAEGAWFVVTDGDPWSDIRKEQKPKTLGDVELIRTLSKPSGLESAVSSCPGIQRFLSSKGIKFGEEAAKTVSATYNPSFSEHAKALAATHLPAISPAGDTAVIADSRSWGPLEGAGQLIKLERRTDGTWVATAVQDWWLS